MMGSRIGPKENGTKEAQVAQNKELTRGSRPEADSYGTRLEGDISEAARIGNCVRDREIVGNRGNCLIVKVRATLKQREGGMSGTRVGSRSKWRQLTAFICEDLNSLLREADEGRARDLQEGSSNSVVRLPPRVGSEEWRRLNGIHRMRPGPGRRKQRVTHSRSYLRRDSTRHLGEFRGSGESGGSPGSSSLSGPLYPKLSTCFEGARLTQLVQLVTADRLFPCHKGQVDLSNR